MNYRECFEKGRGMLAEAGIEEAALDARLLLEFVCGTARHDLLAHGERLLDEREEKEYFDLIVRRAGRFPLQYLTGSQMFMGLDFQVNDHVLIPRQDTEILVEEAMKELHDGMRILDMCTGSGCILLSLLNYSNGCLGVGADISPQALAVASANADRLFGALEEKRKSVEFVCGDLFENVRGKFDMIVSNPPYIPAGMIGTLMPEVRDHEPLEALDGREDGLVFYRRILREGRGYLEHGGRIYFEIGSDQAESVRRLMEDAGCIGVETVRDYAGLDRVVYGTFAG